MSRTKAITFLKSITLIGVYGGLLMPLVFIPIVIFPFVFSKLIFFQTLVGLTFPAYALLALMEPRYRPRFHLLYAAIFAYFIAVALSVVFAADPMRAWWGNQERMNGLFTLLHFFAWLTMAVGVMRTWDQWRRLLNYEVALSAFMAIVALLQKVNKNLLLFPAGDRVGGLLDNPIYMGAYQIFNLFFLLLLVLQTKSKSLRLVYASIGILDLGAFFAAQSRGAFVGLMVGVFTFGLFYGLFTKSRRSRAAVIGTVGLVFMSYGILFLYREHPVVRQSVMNRLVNIDVSKTRLIAWNIAWQGFVERPLTGWGFDNFHILFNAKYNPISLRSGQYETWFDRAHNEILDVLSMTGIIGFLTFIGIYLTLFWSVWRAFRKKWLDLTTASILFALPAAYFVQNVFVFDHPAAFSMSYLLFGFVIAATTADFRGNAEAAPTAPGRMPFSWIVFGVFELLALALVWRTSIMPFQVSRLSIQANQIFGTPAALDAAKQAAEIWTPYLDEQTFLLSRNILGLVGGGQLKRIYKFEEYFALAKRLNEEEVRRHPRNTHVRFIYARLLHEMAAMVPGAAAEAEQQYFAAIETSPKRQQLHYALANLYLRAGRLDDGLTIYRTVRDFDPDFGSGYWLYGILLAYEKRDVQEGSKQIVQSQTVSIKYQLQSVQEAVYLAEAYLALGDKEGLKTVLPLAERFTDAPVSDYVQVAVRFDRAGLTAERDDILAFAAKVDPKTNVPELFKQLLVAPAPGQNAPVMIAPPAAAPPATAPKSNGPGPRR